MKKRIMNDLSSRAKPLLLLKGLVGHVKNKMEEQIDEKMGL